jgi:hypothetical protein
MSTLKVTNIQSNAAGFNDVVSFQNSSGTQNGTLCRAWVNFNGTGTVAIRDNFNVSSITDNGTGNYTVNFTNAMTDANYSIVSMSESETQGSTNRSATVFSLREGTTPTTSACSFVCKQGSFSTATSLDIDKSFMNVAIFR